MSSAPSRDGGCIRSSRHPAWLRHARLAVLLLPSVLLVPPLAQAGGAVIPDEVTVWITARNTGDRLARREPVGWTPLPQPDELFSTVIVDPSKTFQMMEGFGGALTDAAAETFSTWALYFVRFVQEDEKEGPAHSILTLEHVSGSDTPGE